MTLPTDELTLADIAPTDQDEDGTEPPTPEPDVITARNLHLDGKRGRVYGPLDLDIPRGSLTVLTGPAGSGKTALLLTLVGRMRPSKGSKLTVLGRPLPAERRAVQHRTSATGFEGLDDLDEEVRVRDCVRERMAWLAPWYKVVRQPTQKQIDEICRATFGDQAAPPAKQIVHELDESSNLLLRIALAMMSSPDIIVVDQIDQLLDTHERDIVWHRLKALADDGLTIVTATAGREEARRVAWDVAPTIIHLPHPAHKED